MMCESVFVEVVTMIAMIEAGALLFGALLVAMVATKIVRIEIIR